MKALVCFLGLWLMLMQGSTAAVGHGLPQTILPSVTQECSVRADNTKIHRSMSFLETDILVMAQVPAGFGPLLWELDEIQEVQDSNNTIGKSSLIGRRPYQLFAYSRPPTSAYASNSFSTTPASVYAGLRYHISLGILRV